MWNWQRIDFSIGEYKTQQQIADIINTSQSSYAHYENARYLMPLNFLYNLSKIYLDISIDEMLGRKKK